MNIILFTGFCAIFQFYLVNAGWLAGLIRNNDNELLDYKCPDVGHYVIAKDSKENCKKYYSCLEKGARPATTLDCGSGKKFHRLTRECEKDKYVDCKLCAKRGYIEDLTSKKHFIICTRDQIAERYKCKKGEYDAKKKKCDGVKGDSMDLDDDAKPDKVKDVQEFQEKWAEKKSQKDDDSKEKTKKKKKDSSEEEKSEKKKKKKDSSEEEKSEKKKMDSSEEEKSEKKKKKKNSSEEEKSEKKKKKKDSSEE